MTTTKSLADLDAEQFCDLVAAARDAERAIDSYEGAKHSDIDLRLVRSDFDSQRKSVVFHGVRIGWLYTSSLDGTSKGWVASREGNGKQFGESHKTQRIVAELVLAGFARRWAERF